MKKQVVKVKHKESRHSSQSSGEIYTQYDRRHLAKHPEEWELAQGDVEDRVAKVGQNSLHYATLLGVESAGSKNEFWKQVQTLGQDAMKLMGKPERKVGKRQAEAAQDEYAQDLKALEEGDLSAHSGEALPGVFLDDYETQNWSVEQIEAACNTLLTEIETRPVGTPSQDLALKMLLKMMDRHTSATRYLQRHMEDIVNKAMPGLIKRTISQLTWQLAPLLAALASRLGEDLSRLNLVTRLTRFLVFEMDLAAKMIQHRVKLRQRRQRDQEEYAFLPRDAQIRKQMMINMQSDALNAKWRFMHSSDGMGGIVPEASATYYIMALWEMTSKKRGQFSRQDRLLLVKGSGLFPLMKYLSSFHIEGQKTAAKLLLNLAQEKSLLQNLLEAEIIPQISRLIEKTPQKTADGTDLTCLLIEILDAVARAALKFVDINISVAEEQRPNDTASLISHFTAPSLNTFAEAPSEEHLVTASVNSGLVAAIKRHLTSSRLAKVLVSLLQWGVDGRVYLGSVMTLHKLACTSGYLACLEEIMAIGGRGLALLVEGLQSQEPFVPFASMSLLIQLASRDEGRMGLTKSGVIGMLSPLCSGVTSAHTQISLLALSVIQALARQGPCPSFRPSQFSMSSSTQMLVSRLYQEMYEMLTQKAPQESRRSVGYIVSEKVVHCFEAWLVRPDRPAHFYDLPKSQTFIGAILLHRLCSNDTACELLFAAPTVRYLCFTIQTNYTMLAEGDYLKLSSNHLSLFFESIQAACRALGCMALLDCPRIGKAQEIIFNHLSDTSAMDELSCLLLIPSIREASFYNDFVQNATAAAVLVSALAPVSRSEQSAESFQEVGGTEKESVKYCLPFLTRLIKQCGERLINLIQLTESVELLKCTCMALSKLCSINETCHELLSKNLIKAIARLVPKGRPVITGKRDSAERGQPLLVEEDEVDDNLRKLCSLPSSFFRLLGSIARLPEGKKALLGLGLLKRALERLMIRPAMLDPMKNLAVHCEIALFLGRMANMFDENGSANDFILSDKYDCIPCLVTLLMEGKTFRSRFNALFALAEISNDSMRTVPLLIDSNALPPVFKGLKSEDSPQAFVRQALYLVRNVVTYPERKYHSMLLEKHRAREILTRISTNMSLELNFGGVSDRESLGDIARDCLELLTKTGVAKKDNTESNNGISTTKSTEKKVSELSDEPSSLQISRPRIGSPSAGSYLDCGISTCGSLMSPQQSHGTCVLPSINLRGPTSGEDNTEKSTVVRKTYVGRLSVQDESFTQELRRRKQIYQIGRFEAPLLSESVKTPLSHKLLSRKMLNTSKSTGRKSQRSTNQNEITERKVDLYQSKTVVDLKQVPALALTRPPPKAPLTTEMAPEELTLEQFVRFARPPPLMEAASKFSLSQLDPSSVPATACRPIITGHFKAKGLLLDPTFQDGCFSVPPQKGVALDDSLDYLTSQSTLAASDEHHSVFQNCSKGSKSEKMFTHTVNVFDQKVEIQELRKQHTSRSKNLGTPIRRKETSQTHKRNQILTNGI